MSKEVTDRRTRIPICPKCDAEITSKGHGYGQQSYVCDQCNSWGAWENRKTIRNPNNPKKRDLKRSAS